MSIDKFDFSTVGGMSFNVQSDQGVKTIRVIKAELLFEIIRAHQLYLNDPHCEVQDLIDLFTGFEFSPYDVTWFTTSNPRDIPSKAVIQAAKEGNEIVIVELIPRTDADNSGLTSIEEVDNG